ncbi:MAG: proton-conducting transporter membrane subunit [Dehalococcoidales bacterium]|nr:proton-conducting transporter membrane subunit [Dehalococcoidales bacterium]
MLWAYLITGIAILGLMLRPLPQREKRADYLNILIIAQAAVYLGITILALVRVPAPTFYFSRYLMIDNLALYETLISCVVFLLASIYANGYVRSLLKSGEISTRELRLFYAALNLLFTVVVFAFYCNNLALFWILLELTTILSAVLIVTLNAKENIIAALKYVFTASTAMLFSIIGLIILFAMTRQATGAGTLNWDVLMHEAGNLSPALFTFAFVFIFIGFAAKSGIVPFHTWLPQAHAKAPSVISVLLSAVLLNIGIFGILRLYAVARQTTSLTVISNTLIVFGLITIIIAALSMLPRGNVKKLIAFSSIEHMGFILVGIGIGTPVAIYWVLFHTLAHSLLKTQLFFSAGILHQQYESNQFENMKSALKYQPLASWGLIVGSIAMTGVPLFPIFLSKLNILTQLAGYSLPLVFIILLFFVIVAAAFAVILIRVFAQNADHEIEPFRVPLSMSLPIISLFAAVVVLGLYLPNGLQQMLHNIVAGLGV